MYECGVSGRGLLCIRVVHVFVKCVERDKKMNGGKREGKCWSVSIAANDYKST